MERYWVCLGCGLEIPRLPFIAEPTRCAKCDGTQFRKMRREVISLKDWKPNSFRPDKEKGIIDKVIGKHFVPLNERKYRFWLRMLDGTIGYIIKGKDVSAASDNLAKKLDMPLGISHIMERESAEIWNPKKKQWVKSRPWWEEDKEPYEWEK